MLHPLRSTTVYSLLLMAVALPAQAQMCGNSAPETMRGRGPSGPDGPGYRSQTPAGDATGVRSPAEPAPGFAADQSGRTARVYFAVGNEPGWSAEVTQARPRTMTVKTDNGAKTYQVSSVRTRAQSWSGTAADGTAVRLNCGPAPCQDTMSGQVFPGTASLVVGKQTFKGCGGFRD
jgi:uncharacterized membrane protein